MATTSILDKDLKKISLQKQRVHCYDIEMSLDHVWFLMEKWFYCLSSIHCNVTVNFVSSIQSLEQRSDTNILYGKSSSFSIVKH